MILIHRLLAHIFARPGFFPFISDWEYPDIDDHPSHGGVIYTNKEFSSEVIVLTATHPLQSTQDRVFAYWAMEGHIRSSYILYSFCLQDKRYTLYDKECNNYSMIM